MDSCPNLLVKFRAVLGFRKSPQTTIPPAPPAGKKCEGKRGERWASYTATFRLPLRDALGKTFESLRHPKHKPQSVQHRLGDKIESIKRQEAAGSTALDRGGGSEASRSGQR